MFPKDKLSDVSVLQINLQMVRTQIWFTLGDDDVDISQCQQAAKVIYSTLDG